jgi:putative two-component system response regulator
MAREIASFHHERWDGKGYPYGLRGEQIPLAARITAIADVYDALSSKRVYKDAYSHEKCVAIIRDDAGKHFDPVLVEVFLQIESTFLGIARRFGSSECSDESLLELDISSTTEKKGELVVAATSP